MALIAAPFGFMVGSRGAMAGIGVSLLIAISYLALGALFEKLGEVNLLLPAMAAWTPDLIFALTGGYLMMRLRS
jgi:lipopolysaccharide export LptBFGC system permease protein LptF